MITNKSLFTITRSFTKSHLNSEGVIINTTSHHTSISKFHGTWFWTASEGPYSIQRDTPPAPATIQPHSIQLTSVFSTSSLAQRESHVCEERTREENMVKSVYSATLTNSTGVPNTPKLLFFALFSVRFVSSPDLQSWSPKFHIFHHSLTTKPNPRTLAEQHVSAHVASLLYVAGIFNS